MPPYAFKDKREFERAARAIRTVERIEARPKKGKRPRRGGGGGSTTALTNHAIVTEPAGPSTYTPSGITGGTIGKAVLLDENKDMTGTAEIEFRSLQIVGMPVDSIIELTSDQEITPGSVWTDKKVWGAHVSAPHELYQLQGAAPQKVLWLPSGATSAEDMEWAGKQCET